MSEIIVKPVTSKRDLISFIKLPWSIYNGNQYWVPPIIMDKKHLLDKERNPFFKHAEMEMFLAYKNNELVGRIAAIKNDLHNSTHNDLVGFFGFFDSVNDQTVADALFNKVQTWLKEKGLTQMRGPANPSSNDEYGLLVEGFDDSPRLLMPYNHPYYLSLIENSGFKKAKDLFAYKIENEKILKSEKLLRISEIARKRSGVSIRSINLKDFEGELQLVKYVYNKAWAPNWGFVPFTEEEINAVAKDLKPLVDPNLVLFAEINGQTIGFALVMPDYNYVFKKMNGRLFPFGIFKLFTLRKKIPWARILILGIIPEFQKRGIDSVFYHEIVERAEARGILLGEASWVLEDNDMMIRGAEVMNGTLYKRYRLYQKDI